MDGKNLTNFLIGAAVGGAVGVLLAPEKGEKTRAQLKNKFGSTMDTVGAKVDDVKINLAEKKDQLKDDIIHKGNELKGKLIDKKNEVLAKVDEATEKITDKIESEQSKINGKRVRGAETIAATMPPR
jgi:gas vesicle protein